MSFDDLAARALDTATKRGAEYADVRFEIVRSERIETRNGVVATLSDATSRGYGMRALVGGAWGFAAASDLTPAGMDRAAARAVEIAKAGAAIARHPFGAPPPRAYVDSFATPIVRDPVEVPLGQRVALLLDAEPEPEPEDAGAGEVWAPRATPGSTSCRFRLRTLCGYAPYRRCIATHSIGSSSPRRSTSKPLATRTRSGATAPSAHKPATQC